MPLNGEPFTGTLQKPERKAAGDKRGARQKFVARRQCRHIVYRRENMTCQRCGLKLKSPRECYPTDPQFPHVNEIVLRSKGGDPLDPDNCELLCGACHMPNGEHAPTAERMRTIQQRTRRA